MQKIKEKLADFKEFKLEGVTANNPKIEELKARQIAIDNEIGEMVKNKIIWYNLNNNINGR